MNSKERVLRTLEFKETDRVPLAVSGREDDLMLYLKANSLNRMYEILDIDFRGINTSDLQDKRGVKRTHKGHEANIWGVPLICANNGFQELCPLSEISSVDEAEAYDWPLAENLNYYDIEKQITENDGYFLIAGVWAPIFHDFTWLCGFENCLAMLLSEPEIAKAVLRRITDFWIAYTKIILEKGKGKIDCVMNCNDFGMQKCLIMSPGVWREFFKPELKRFYGCIKNFGANVFQHSCGSIFDIIPDLIEIGADILDPIQVAAVGMGTESLAEKFGGKIVCHGGIDTQFILPNCSEPEVRAEVRRVIGTLGSRGGYILCGSQGYMEDIPIENIVAVYDEAKKVKVNILENRL